MEKQQIHETPVATPGYTTEEERSIIQAAFRLAREKDIFTRADIKYALGWSLAQWQTITAVCNAYHLVPESSSLAEETPTEDFVKSSIQTALRLTRENPNITRMDILHELAWGPTQWIRLNAICDMYGIASPSSDKATKNGVIRDDSLEG